MEAAIQSLVKVYLKFSKGKENLGKKDFQNLVKGQLSNILSDTDSKEAVNNMATGLDENQDGRLGFPEYMKLIGYLATSLSEQRCQVKEEPAPNTATGQVTQTSPDQEDKPEANAKAKAEVKEEATAEAAAGVKVEACVEPKAEAEGEVKAEGEAPPKEVITAVGEEVATAEGEVVVTTTTTVVEVTEEVTGEVKEVKVEETVVVEEVPAAEKTEETTS